MNNNDLTKTCSVCQETKILDCFYKDKSKSLGVDGYCKLCRIKYVRRYQETHTESTKEHKRNWHKKNPTYCEQYRKANPEYFRQWNDNNKDKLSVYYKTWRDKNPEKVKAQNAKYRAHKGKGTPKWLSLEHRRQILEIYKNCPSDKEVDHIIPLRGQNVSGLHVPWNLQYLAPIQNRRKNNKVA